MPIIDNYNDMGPTNRWMRDAQIRNCEIRVTL